ncbi:hypothetical protein [Pararhizobium sp. IMCC21322]|uniref:hypothetical protein n=1 Tax=Pararhizobium sp. IMCC21322 TaxID=3067903 RepID=UPI0027418F62|nr:hypothetical protein [Pararhizobium sp. IMCC21322]
MTFAAPVAKMGEPDEITLTTNAAQLARNVGTPQFLGMIRKRASLNALDPKRCGQDHDEMGC